MDEAAGSPTERTDSRQAGSGLSLSSLIVELGDAVADVVVGGSTAPAAVDISFVTHDSREVATGALFACVRGEHSDGHSFAQAAVDAGAAALLVDHQIDPATVGAVPQIIVGDTRRCLGAVASAVVGHPSRALTTVGITGTNGKTTTSLMLASIFEANGWGAGVIGTLSGSRTTPEAPELQRTLAGFLDAGHQAAVLEVSSHALALHRVDSTEFDTVVFTNFGHDHLDLHGTPEEYFRAKASLFTPRFAPLGIINTDDTHGQLLADVAAADGFDIVAYSSNDLDDISVGATTLSYRWRGHRVVVNIGGRFNLLNSLAALVTADQLGIEVDVAVAGLAAFDTIPGRFESIVSPADQSAEFTVVVDYAHTPDGLQEVLESARAVIHSDNSVIVVFGCGGDRDRAKRPEMGAAAARNADRVFITSDNPRTEDPQTILDDIVEGVESNYRARVTLNSDRRMAIGEALSVARNGDIVVIAGKGHERTQDHGGHIIDFDDRVVAHSFLEESS